MLSTLLHISREKLEGHREQLPRLHRTTRGPWISMNSDGPDCPLGRVYSEREVRELFSSFANVRTEVHFFDRMHWPFIGQLISDRAAKRIGARLGWNGMVYAARPWM